MRYSIIRRLILIVFLCLFPLLLAQLFLYSWNRNHIAHEIETFAAQQVNYICSSLEKQTKDVLNAARQVIANGSTLSFFTKLSNDAFESVSEYYTLMRDMRNELNTIRYGTAIVDNIMVLFPQEGVHVTADYTVSGVFPNFSAVCGAVEKQGHLLTEINDALYIAFAYPNESIRPNSRLVVMLRMKQEALMEMLASLNVAEGRQTMIYKPDSNYLLIKKESADFSKEDMLLPLASLDNRSTRRDIEVAGKRYIIFSHPSNILNCVVIHAIPYAQLMRVPDSVAAFMLVLLLATLLALICMIVALRHAISHPVDSLQNAFNRAARGNFSYRLPEQTTKEFNGLASGYNSMAEHIESLIDTNYRQTLRMQSAVLRELQAQINPHFLYNSFFFLKHMLQSRDLNAGSVFCQYLGQYFQYITESDRDTLSLKSEYEHMLNYANIQRMRFEETVELRVMPLPEETGQWPVPRLILQPVMENCFKHGTSYTDEEISIIQVSFRQFSPYGMDILIENSGKHLTDETICLLNRQLESASGTDSFTGLTNTHQRLKYFFGKEAGIQASRSSLGGLLIRIRIFLRDDPKAQDVKRN